MNKIESQIHELSNMIDGLDISLERIKELTERIIFNHYPFESSEEMTFSLETLRTILQKDRGELKATMKELQKQL